MKTISRITLFSLLSISLSHAMEEKDITPGKKGNLKGSGDYATFSSCSSSRKQMKDTEAEFYTDATHLLLQEVVYVLTNGGVPEYQEDTKRIKFYDNKYSNRPSNGITSEEEAEDFLLKRIGKYFDGMIKKDKKTQKKQKEARATNKKIKKEYSEHYFFNNGLQNATVITEHVNFLPEDIENALDKEEKEQECTFNRKVRTNEFRSYVAVTNYRLLPQCEYYQLHSFNDEMIRLIQNRIAEVSTKKVAQEYGKIVAENNKLNKKIDKREEKFKEAVKEFNAAIEARKAADARAEKLFYIGLPSSFTVGAVAGSAAVTYTAYKAGYINTDKVAQDATNIINTAKGFLGNNS